MEIYDEFKSKSNEELLKVISEEGMVNVPERRDCAKAILDVRSAKIMQRHNTIMIWLTGFIAALTFVVAILTALLVYKEFWQTG